MITHNDQLELFRLISKNIKKDIDCYAFGGTAMMFYGFKDETKDVDLCFEEEREREEFINSIHAIGFAETSAMNIYIPEKLRDKHRPLMFKREDYRFDLFVKKIFRTQISPKMKEDLYAIHDFKVKFNFKIKILRTEHIVLLKGITERQNDFYDIQTILNKDKHFNWQYLVDEAIWQHNNGDTWVLLDMEKMMRDLKKYIFIEEKYFRQIYEAQK